MGLSSPTRRVPGVVKGAGEGDDNAAAGVPWVLGGLQERLMGCCTHTYAAGQDGQDKQGAAPAHHTSTVTTAALAAACPAAAVVTH